MKLFLKISQALLLCVLLWRPEEASAGWTKLSVGGSEGRVIGIAADTYDIDIGVSEGAQIGDYYLVYERGGDIVDGNGVVIGNYRIPVAVLKARGVSTGESSCEVASPSKGWVIQRGDMAMSISSASADALRFATYRTTPNRPRLRGFYGRWVRIAPTLNPVNVVANYYYHWTSPSAPGTFPPGFYYFEPTKGKQRDAMPATPYLIPPPPAAAVPVQPAYSPPPVAAPIAPPQPLFSHPPNYWAVPEFDANDIADARLIRTFPLTLVEMQALEIQHKEAWGLYAKRYYPEAFNAFCQQALNYRGNYLSPYWAGASALKLGDGALAIEWFKMALAINPNYKPALDAVKREVAQQKKKATEKK